MHTTDPYIGLWRDAGGIVHGASVNRAGEIVAQVSDPNAVVVITRLGSRRRFVVTAIEGCRQTVVMVPGTPTREDVAAAAGIDRWGSGEFDFEPITSGAARIAWAETRLVDAALLLLKGVGRETRRLEIASDMAFAGRELAPNDYGAAVAAGCALTAWRDDMAARYAA